MAGGTFPRPAPGGRWCPRGGGTGALPYVAPLRSSEDSAYHDPGVHPRGRITEEGNMAVMRVAQVPRPNGPFEIVERPIPEPGAGSVRIKVQACGICHSDSLVKEGIFPDIAYPRVPGHEVA